MLSYISPFAHRNFPLLAATWAHDEQMIWFVHFLFLYFSSNWYVWLSIDLDRLFQNSIVSIVGGRNFWSVQKDVHLCHPKQECKYAIGPVWGVLCLLNSDGQLLEIIVIVKIMSVDVLVPKNIWILEPHCLPVDAPLSLIATSIHGAICCNKHDCLIWLLNYIDMKVLDIYYSIKASE